MPNYVNFQCYVLGQTIDVNIISWLLRQSEHIIQNVNSITTITSTQLQTTATSPPILSLLYNPTLALYSTPPHPKSWHPLPISTTWIYTKVPPPKWQTTTRGFSHTLPHIHRHLHRRLRARQNPYYYESWDGCHLCRLSQRHKWHLYRHFHRLVNKPTYNTKPATTTLPHNTSSPQPLNSRHSYHTPLSDKSRTPHITTQNSRAHTYKRE